MKYYLFQQDDDEAYKQKISVANNFLTLIGDDDDDAAWLTWQQGKNLLSYIYDGFSPLFLEKER